MPFDPESGVSVPEVSFIPSPDELLCLFFESRREACSKHYRYKLGECAAMLGLTLEKFVERLIDHPDDLILPLRRAMLERGLCVTTRQKLFKVLKTFCRHMFFSGYMKRVPAIPLEKVPKQWVDKYEIVTAEDIAVVEQWVSQLPNKESLVCRALVALLYYRALRVSEVVSIRLGDINFQDGIISIIEKGGESRNQIPVSGAVMDMIEPLYRMMRRLVGNIPEQHLFTPPGLMYPTVGDKTLPAMDVDWVLRWVSVKVAGILDKKVTPHSMRRSAITALVEMDTPILAAAAFARHSTAHMLEHYYQRKEQSARDCQERLDALHHKQEGGNHGLAG